MIDAPPIVLTVAGSDPSGGAGLQADLKAFHQHGAYGLAVPTLITVQNTLGVDRVELLSAELVRAQLAALLGDVVPTAAKTGALGTPAVVEAVGSFMEESDFPWVVDPVWLPSAGRPLAKGDVVSAYKDALVPRAALLTPNAQEAALLAEIPVRTLGDARDAAKRIEDLGASAVLVKGGHLQGDAKGTDLLLHEGGFLELPAAELVPGRFHGTGCALSATIAVHLASGSDVPTAVHEAKAWLTGSLAQAFAVGGGALPVNHFWHLEHKA